MVEIRHRFMDKVLFADQLANSVREAVLNAFSSGAALSGANLRSADLTPIRDDLWAVLSSAPSEASTLLTALRAGKVDGSTYTGDCACLVGTLANAKMCFYNSIAGLTPDSSRPAEMFFGGISKGDTLETSQFCKIAAEWTEEWIGHMKDAFGRPA